MHEHSICEGLLAQVLRLAEAQQAERVERIHLQVGALSGIEPTLLADAFPFVSAGTIVEGAELIIDSVGVRVRCTVCGAETHARPEYLACGVCGGKTQLVAGDEVMLVSVDLRQPKSAAVRH